MIHEFDFFGIYFSAMVPRLLVCLVLWLPIYRLIGALQMSDWIYFPSLMRLASFLCLLAILTFVWHP